MKLPTLTRFIAFIFLISSSIAQAGPYVELSLGQMEVDTPDASSYPSMADFRFGYSNIDHQIEIAFMTSLQDGKVHQLAVSAPLVTSVLYHYLPYPDNHLKLHFIVGASQIEIKSSYPGVSDSTDRFSGVSYGIGFEESFVSMPQLKLSLDWIQLYRGDDLNFTTLNLGAHYEF